MTDERQAEELADRALNRLRDAITTGAVAPPAATLRTHARRWLRARQATAGGLAAVTVAAVALGGTAVWQPTAGPPPAANPSGAPSPTAPADAPIDQLDWTTATITLPPEHGCPSGPVGFVPQEQFTVPHSTEGRRWEWATAMGPADGFPAVALWLNQPPGFGDLTGDGRPEAVLRARCFPTEDSVISGDALLVVTRQPDGTLAGLGWVGPPDDVREPYWTSFLSYWVADGRLLVDAALLADPGTPRPDPHPPGQALSYRWDGERLVDDGPAAEYPPLLPVGGEGAGPPVRLGPVADGLGCPDAELRFTRDPTISLAAQPDLDFSGGGAAPAGDDTYRFRPNHYRQHLFDLDGSGQRRLLVTIKCWRTDGVRVEGLAVFERAGDGWQGVSVLPSPTEPGRHYLVDWRPDGPDLVVSWTFDDSCAECDRERVADQRYRWTGSELAPVDE